LPELRNGVLSTTVLGGGLLLGRSPTLLGRILWGLSIALLRLLGLLTITLLGLLRLLAVTLWGLARPTLRRTVPLRGLLTVARARRLAMGGLLESGCCAAGRVHSHAEECHSGSPAGSARVLACGLEATGCCLLHEGVAARAAQGVGLLNIAEQSAGVFVVFDRGDRDLDDFESAVSEPQVVLFDGLAHGLAETNRTALNPRDAVAHRRIAGLDRD